MNREQIAMHLFSSILCDGDLATERTAQWAFDQADVFLLYCEKHREPKAECEHLPEWRTSTGCAHCGAAIVPPVNTSPEPVKKSAECEHVWTDPVEKGKFHCLYCGAPKVQPEPTKPERKAIFLVHESYLIDAETRSEMHKENLEANGYVYVHKVQPGGGGE